MLPESIKTKIETLYGSTDTNDTLAKLQLLLDRYQNLANSGDNEFLTEKDSLLITYADTLFQPGFEPLKSLNQFCQHRLDGIISTVHILPFFPYSSDDGFSVIDYRQVNPAHGDWPDVNKINQTVDLCFDLVINHASQESHYFKGYLNDDPSYKNFFIELNPTINTSAVVRPRALSLAHKYTGPNGDKWCWTTFSEDQLDLNFKTPQVLLEMIDILLFYVSNGARIIRLDAIAYLWKEPGTTCVHLPQTHLVVQLMRDVLDLVAPNVLLLSETNFPHEDNISYFGDGRNEAQITYNFPMPPLVLHALTEGDAYHLTEWASSIEPLSDKTTFLNFTASHDGIGVRPVADILNKGQFQRLIDLASHHGGKVSFKNDQNGNPIPYELNINYFDAINNPNDQSVDEQTEIARFMLSQSIPLVFLGMPAIYIHSLIGSRNWTEGVQQTGHPRTINRQRLNLDVVEQLLHDNLSRQSQVYHKFQELLTIRKKHTAFHPNAPQNVLDLDKSIFALTRTATDKSDTILAIHNVTNTEQIVNLNLAIDWPDALIAQFDTSTLIDLITDQPFQTDQPGSFTLTLKPYQFLWLTPANA